MRTGQELEQPADLVILSAFQMHNVRLLLLSGIGAPYDPSSGPGPCRERTTRIRWSRTRPPFFGKDVHIKSLHWRRCRGNARHRRVQLRSLRSFQAGLRGGRRHHGAGATGGGDPSSKMLLPPDTSRWGSVLEGSSSQALSPLGTGDGPGLRHVLSRPRTSSLDPTYKDKHGVPLLRISFDWHDNEYRMAAYAASKMEGIVREMHPQSQATLMFKPGNHYDTRIYQSTHTTGGAIMGSSPASSVINRYSQSWEICRTFLSTGHRRFLRMWATTPPGSWRD